VLELVDPHVAPVHDSGEQPLVGEPTLIGDQLDVARAAAEVEADPLDGQVTQDAVRVSRVVEVGLDEDPRTLASTRELLIGEPQHIELALGAILDEARLVELHPVRALIREALDHLSIDGQQRLEQGQAIELLGAVRGLAEQQQ
jgi:hypothetical protein